MPAEVSSAPFKPVYVVRHKSWCPICEKRTHLMLDVDEPTCDVCLTVHPAIHISAPAQTCVTPFVYGRPLL